MKLRRILVLLLCLSLLPLCGLVRAEGDLEQLIIDSCTYNQKVDISQYGLTVKELEEVYYRLQYEGRLPWYASHEYTYYYNELTGQLLEFEPLLLKSDQMTYEEAVAALLDACILEGMSDWQKALALHDQLVLRGHYDDTYRQTTGYDLLIDGTAVCSGYAALYQDLLLRLGIPCLQIDSEEMDHVWNLVQLEGSWYHVDLTWADPSPNHQGMVDHSYFLKTDEEMQTGEDPHYGWDTDIQCTDGTYADAFWNGVWSGILFTDPDTCYYLRDRELTNSLIKRTVSTGKETTLYTEKERPIDIGQGKYTYFHTGLTLREDRLWLCTMKEVLSLDLQGKNRKTEYTYDATKRYLAGCWVEGETLHLTVADHEGDTLKLTREVSPTDGHTHRFTRTVTAPTCSQAGFSTSLCACGLTATGSQTAPMGHSWQEQAKQEASPFSEGFVDNLCTVCDATEHQVLEKLSFLEWSKDFLIVIIALTAIPVSIFIHKHSKFKS